MPLITCQETKRVCISMAYASRADRYLTVMARHVYSDIATQVISCAGFVGSKEKPCLYHKWGTKG